MPEGGDEKYLKKFPSAFLGEQAHFGGMLAAVSSMPTAQVFTSSSALDAD